MNARLLSKGFLKAFQAVVLFVCCLGVMRGSWLGLTLAPGISGLHFTILAYSLEHSGSPMLSYGFWAAVALVLVLVGFWIERKDVLCLASAMLLILAILAWLQIALGNTTLLTALTDENSQAHSEQAFTNRFVSINGGMNPTFWGAPLTATVSGRLLSGLYFLSIGWYVAVTVGLSVFSYGMYVVSPRWRRAVALSGALTITVLFIGFGINPFRAHRAYADGQTAETAGDLTRANREYRRAIALDTWYSEHTDLYVLIGRIDGLCGKTGTFEYRIYHAEVWVAQNNLASAIDELQHALLIAGPRTVECRQWMARLCAAYGLQLFANHSYGPAVEAWQKALSYNRRMLTVSYFLSRAYYEIGNYNACISTIRYFLPLIKDASLRANLDSNLGDALTQTGDYAGAHAAYQSSYKLDNVKNVRGLLDAVGNY